MTELDAYSQYIENRETSPIDRAKLLQVVQQHSHGQG